MKTLSNDASISLDFVIDMHAHSTSMNAFCFVNLDEDLGKMNRSLYSQTLDHERQTLYPGSQTPHSASDSAKPHTLETHATFFTF